MESQPQNLELRNNPENFHLFTCLLLIPFSSDMEILLPSPLVY